MSGPLSRVLEAFSTGASSLAEIAARTGLPADVVSGAVDHLVRAGRLSSKELAIGCPSGGCGSCASGTPDGAPGCGAPRPSRERTGRVLVALSLPVRPG